MSNPSEADSGALASRPHPGILRHTSAQPRETVINVDDNEKAQPKGETDDLDEDEESEEKSETDTYHDSISGRWGEGPSNVNVMDAQRDFRKLKRELTKRSSMRRSTTAEKPEDSTGGFDLTSYLEDLLPRADNAGIKRHNLGVAWENLEVLGTGLGAQTIQTFGDPFIALANLFNPLFWAKKAFSKGEKRSKTITRTIIYPMNGFCNPGEMILVLGRPGAGCSTLLRVLANDRKNYKSVLGDVTYGPFTADEIGKYHRGEVLYNQEDDFHYPTLTVRETLEAALRTKTPGKRLPELNSRKAFVEQVLGVLTKMYGLTKQVETVVGNAFIRGISGGERKRLSIAEQMATRSSVNMWDGSTRGLDASSALDYVKSLRVQTNLVKKSTMVSIYQASENIYDLFDKTLLLYDGRCIYFGPANKARQYFIDLGFVCPPRQTTADFLTACTDPHERKPRPGFEGRVPHTPKEFENAFKQSEMYNLGEIRRQEYQASVRETNPKEDFKAAAKQIKQKHVSVKNPYTVNFASQVKTLTIRQVQLVKGDYASLVSRYASNVIKAIIVGTVFIHLPTNGSGTFTRGGVLFFALLFNALVSQAELPSSLQGRPILYKHKKFAMYRPSAFAIAQIVTDLPLVAVQILLFSVCLYFTVGLQLDAGKFFMFCLILAATALCMTAFFRMWGAVSATFDSASRTSGLILMALILYSGFMIPYQSMHPWFIWIFWINPLAYAFKALISNEMSGLIFDCANDAMIPSGPGYTDMTYQVCGVPGATAGQPYVDGSSYLYAAYRYKTSEMWIDFAAIILFWLFFVAITCWALETKEFGKGGFSTNVYKKGAVVADKNSDDEEAAYDNSTTVITNTNSDATPENSDFEVKDMAKGSVFAWENVDYVVPYKADPSGQKQLLTKVAGLVKPGTMTALMGSSGAGKTTLLDVLAQRKNIGKVTGQIEVDGLPLRRDFQRTTGYCEQLDVHVPECTVREALRFSAHLRQPADVSEADKDAYVEEIIKILEMENIADALIGTTESGLGISVEERKRLTIGVELVAKPKLLFLDEPTSGLDAQASYNIMRFMRKLTDQGQAILCTIHQPSSQLFAFFDDLLLLAKGGHTVYFGELGDDSKDLISYFERNGAPHCASDANPAEYILDVVNAHHADLDWVKIWEGSPEKVKLLKDISATRKAESGASHDTTLEYAAPLKMQIKYVFQRMNRTYWRLPQYNFGRLAMQVVFALLNGFSFYKLGSSKLDLQCRVFAVFQVAVMAALLVNMIEPRFHTERQWFYRELAGKYYGWKPFAIAITLTEIPYVLLTMTVFFLVFYWTVGFLNVPILVFYTWLMFVQFSLFATSLGQLIAAWTPSTQVAALLNPFIFSALNLFSGVMMPYNLMPEFWRSWLYWLDPYHYVIEGLVAAQLHGVPVRCKPDEFSVFPAPAGQTCGEYTADFLSRNTGYINNPNATTNCEYCQYSVGDDYFEPMGMSYSNIWRNFGILWIYVVFNVVMLLVGIRYFRANRR
ncbi:hypothetical protein DFQ26_009790 [Actinomortierella ambigua]|nr:hypothetical protein DFQ26_009790 [Actinomortierella ambigua]